MGTPKEFIHTLDSIKGLRANKDYTKFYYRCKIHGREFSKSISFTDKPWGKADRKKSAIAWAIQFKKDKTRETVDPFDRDTTVDYVANEYFETGCKQTKWNTERRRLYELHIQPHIGKKKASRVIQHDIDKIRAEMKSVNHPKYSENKVGAVAKPLSDRSIEKVLLQVLKPILVYAQSNGAIERLPKIDPQSNTPKSKRKKKVQHGVQKLTLLYKAIMTRHNDNAYYRTLFLFALYGRRWNEIKTLTWEAIDLDNDTYTIFAKYNKVGEDQEYALPSVIKASLLEVKDDHIGLVFKPHRGGKELHPPKKQLAKLREDTGIEELTMHYFRHILVTAMGEEGTNATVMSAALGHTDSRTLEKHYLSHSHTLATSKVNQQVGQIIDVELSDSE